MKKKINQLAKGMFDAKIPAVRLLTAPVHETVLCGQVYNGILELGSDNNTSFRGLAYADDDRIVFPENSFAGFNVQIEYTLDASAIRDNTEIKGSFILVTNGGDVRLPYEFEIRQPILLENDVPASARELGELAAEKPDLAIKLFESDQFLRLPLLKDDGLRALHASLRQSPDHRMAMEEFLAACGAKQAVTVTVDDTPQTYRYHEENSVGEFYMARNAEGYISIRVTTDAPFIRLPHERWSTLDFSGNNCRVPFSFVRRELHSGKNTGTITVNTGRTVVTIPVTVFCEDEQSIESRRDKQYRRSRLQLYRTLTVLYAGQEEGRGTVPQALKLMDSCDAFRKPDAAQRLLRAEIYRRMGKRAEERQLLEEIRAGIQRNKLEDPTSYVWFLYLEEEIDKGDQYSDAFLRLIQRMKDEDRNSADIFPLHIRADSEWADQPEKTLQRMRDFFVKGDLNLLLKTEACRIYNEHPELMTKISPFERNILVFGSRCGAFSQEMATRAAELLSLEKQYHPAYVRILTALYSSYREKNILYALLSLLMRGGQLKPIYHEWYARGIEEDVRLTELYEYYLSTLPANFKGEIPQMVLLYYTYNRPQKRQACLALYRYILHRYEKDSHLYRLYEKQIQTFALEQLLAGAADDDLAELYERMFIPEVLEPKTAALLTDLLYTEHLYFSNKKISEVIMLYGELQHEFAYPVRNGEAYVPVYARNARTVFVDDTGVRYARTGIKRRKLMNTDDSVTEACRKLNPDGIPFRLAACQKGLSVGVETEEEREILQQYLDWEELSPAYRQKLILAMIKGTGRETPEALPLLKALKDSPYLDTRAGKMLTESFLTLSDDESATQMLHRFGYRMFRPELLLSLVTRQIREQKYEYVSELFGVTLSMYRDGVMNSVTLTYLCRYYNSGTEEMYSLLKTAMRDGGALFYDLPERLLAQMLFTGEEEHADEVFRCYAENHERPDRTLLHAYAVTECSRYFQRDARISEDVFDYVKQWAAQEKKPEYLPVICQLALTRHCAESESLSEDDKALLETMLRYLYDRGFLFSYEKKLARFISLPAELSDKTLIEYHGSSDVSVEIGMRILPGEADEAMTYTEMPHIFGGVYVKPVLLFAGELLEYEIVTVKDGHRTVTEAGTKRWEPLPAAVSNRFDSLNRLVTEAGNGEASEWQQKVIDYGMTDVMLKEYFDCR